MNPVKGGTLEWEFDLYLSDGLALDVVHQAGGVALLVVELVASLGGLEIGLEPGRRGVTAGRCGGGGRRRRRRHHAVGCVDHGGGDCGKPGSL